MRALKIYIDVEQVKTTTGRDFSEPNEDTADNYAYNLLYRLQRLAEYLESHNKNLTKEQHRTAEELKDILNAMSNGGEVVPRF